MSNLGTIFLSGLLVVSSTCSSGCTDGALKQNRFINRNIVTPTTATPPKIAETRIPVSIGLAGYSGLVLSPDSMRVSHGSPLMKHGGTLVSYFVPSYSSGVSGF
jgi:hypothetical protein